MTNEQLQQFQSEVVAKIMEEGGVECLLPQNMSDEWLDLLAEEVGSFDEDAEDVDFTGTVLCVIQILNYQSRDTVDGNGDSHLSTEELCERCFAYTMFLSLERVSRKTNIEISSPTLEDIFDMDKTHYMRIKNGV